MKITFFLIILFSVNFTFSQEIECEEPTQLQKLANVFSLPNCTKKEYLADIKFDTEMLCDECKSKFESIYGSKISAPEKKTLQKQFFEAALEEYKKNIIDNLIFATKLRALPSTGSSFEKSKNLCQLKLDKNSFSSCNPAVIDLISNTNKSRFEAEIAGELAKILSTDQQFKPEKLLLNRNKQACFIPEKDILYLSNSIVEEELSSPLLNSISNLDPKKYSSIRDLFNSSEVKNIYKEDIDQFLSYLKHHPQLSLLNKPEKLVEFAKKIPSPKDLKDLRETLYNKETGSSLDQQLSDRCDQTFNAFKGSICNSNFSSAEIDTDPFRNFSKLPLSKIVTSEKDHADSDEMINLNISLLQQCEVRSGENKLKLNDTNENISLNLDSKYKDYSLDLYKTEKFDSEIGLKNEYLCDSKNKNCDLKTLNCKLFKKHEGMNDKESLDYKLANSSNKEVNTLLRSMIGDTTNIDPKTREILVANGILPKSDGTLVAQEDIPERRPDFFSHSSSQAKVSNTTTGAGTPASAQRASVASQSPRSGMGDSFVPQGAPQGTSANHDISDLFKESDQNLRDVQNEIMRRLSSLPNQRPTTKEEARQLTRDSFRARGAPLTPAKEEAIASRLMGQTSAQDNHDAFFNRDLGNTREVASTNTETLAEKFKKDSMNRALSDMAGARANSAATGVASGQRSPASIEDNSKQLTTVALNITDDPKVSLSQIFGEKFNKNDSETQLLKVLVKNKKNFLLQVRNVNFKAVFDENNKLKLLYDSGDKEEAQKIRPQLEIFFKRLSSV